MSDDQESANVSSTPIILALDVARGRSAERLLDVAERLLTLQAASAKTPEISTALKIAALRMRVVRVAHNVLHPKCDVGLALPAFLLQLSALVEDYGLARVRLGALDFVCPVPSDVVSALGLYAAHKVIELIEDTPPDRLAEICIRLRIQGTLIELNVEPASFLNDNGTSIRPGSGRPNLRLV